ncbi:MAG TPA: energy transducer TonB [Rhodocyclaceae bacterium]|nr:energy transducer TonB [Rhodocyclaceae bacterium]
MHTADYEDPGKWSALLLALLMHALLAAALLVSVKWQTRPQPVTAELWTPRDLPQFSEPAPPEVQPPVAAPPPPPPVVKTEPPRPAPAPPPEIKLKADKKPKEKTPPDSKKPAPSFDDLLAREETQLDRRKIEQDRQRRLEEETRLLKQAREEQENQRRSAARAQAQAAYTDRIKGKIRGNLVQPPNLKGNPVALFVVTQLPSGEVLEVKLRRSSGNPLYDDAVERAIRKSSPLPRPDDSALFARDLLLTFCPDEERGCSR